MSRINGQIVVYVVVGAVLLLVGLNSIRGEKEPDSLAGTADAAAAGSGGFELSPGGGRKLVVDVSGEVRRPGVYRFAHGARVIDAISRAGGTTADAQVGALNRAATLSDGQQVLVPSAEAVGAVGAGAGGESSVQVPISLGSATQEQLEEIDGIGPVTAQKILEFRDSSGGLGSIDELDQVSGIGPVTMDSLRAALQP